MKLFSIFVLSLFAAQNVFALGFTQNNRDYVVHCFGDGGSTWDSSYQGGMVNEAHGLKLCADSKPSIAVNINPTVRPKFTRTQLDAYRDQRPLQMNKANSFDK